MAVEYPVVHCKHTVGCETCMSRACGDWRQVPRARRKDVAGGGVGALRAGHRAPRAGRKSTVGGGIGAPRAGHMGTAGRAQWHLGQGVGEPRAGRRGAVGGPREGGGGEGQGCCGWGAGQRERGAKAVWAGRGGDASEAREQHGRGTVAALAGCRGSGSVARGRHRRGTGVQGVWRGGAAGGAQRRRWIRAGQRWRQWASTFIFPFRFDILFEF